MSDALKKEKVKVDKAWLAYLEAAKTAAAVAAAVAETAVAQADKAYAAWEKAAEMTEPTAQHVKAYLSTEN